MARQKSAGKGQSVPAGFIKHFFSNLNETDRAQFSAHDQKQIATGYWHFLAERKPAAKKIRLYNPTPASHGWHSDHSVLEIVTDDMPFLVDSVTGELNRRGYNVHLFIHPTAAIARDSKGRCTGFHDKKNAKDITESLMMVFFDQCLDDKIFAALEKDLHDILDEVKAATEDWQKMRRSVRIAMEEAGKPSSLASDEVSSGQDFLQWLDDNNFTFLGYRELVLSHKGKLALNVVKSSGLGILRDPKNIIFAGLLELSTQPPEVQKFMQEKSLLIVSKTRKHSRIHRTVPMDVIFVKRLDDKGRVMGMHMFVGLFTSASYWRTPREIPILNKKIHSVVRRSGFDVKGHDGKALIHILDNYPRDELFQISENELYNNALGILQLQERQRVALFTRVDRFDRFVGCIIYVPRERWDTNLRNKFKRILEESYQATIDELNVTIDDSPLARIFLTLRYQTGSKKPKPDNVERALQEAARSWHDRIQESLIALRGEALGLKLLADYTNAFSPTYRETYSAAQAVHDIKRLEDVFTDGQFCCHFYRSRHDNKLHLKLYNPGNPTTLSSVMPLLEHMGLHVQSARGPYAIEKQGQKVWMHEFLTEAKLCPALPFDILQGLFNEALPLIWQGSLENDGFNSLLLIAGLSGRDIVLLRAFAKYLRQLRIPYSQDMMEKTLAAHPDATKWLVALFDALHNPFQKRDKKTAQQLRGKLMTYLQKVTAIEEDRILRRYLNLIDACLRTNFYQKDSSGAGKTYVSFKFSSGAIEYMPLPKPYAEIFVYSPDVEAVHLRGGKVARGGIRWSDRREDFRNEILGLMKAQQVKNVVIVPVGSKGGFIVKNPSTDPTTFKTQGIACYQTMIRGLLDITDNRVGNKIVPPKDVVRHDGDDPYLVVAADKGTAKFSDIANKISQSYGFWLDDAFASGGSVGYDHKHMGITARGAWEAIKRHFREIDIDIQSQDFTCIGVGDMSGDVFGNAMLLSKHIRLQAAFDHRHIFLDPHPITAKSYAERARLFALPTSSWADYNAKLISKGGGVFSRQQKSIKLSAEVRAWLGLSQSEIGPNELIHILLKTPVDLLYFGGIGTFVKAISESHEQVSDRANDACRVDGIELQARVVGEGANLGFTQKARIEFALNGGRINTDAIDNSAGVDTSDHEVNIKILLGGLVRDKKMTLPQRNKLLTAMTKDVATLVLRDNYLQTAALSLAESESSRLLPLHAQLIRRLEKQGLNRAIEFLPDDDGMAERLRLGKGLTRPELAVVLAYTKMGLYNALEKSPLLGDPSLQQDLMDYFPPALQKGYASAIKNHQLRREIMCTVIVNDLVNRMGPHFVFAHKTKSGADVAAITAAYRQIRGAYHMADLWQQIEMLDTKATARVQTDMYLTINEAADYAVTRLIKHKGQANPPTLLFDHVGELQQWLTKKAPSYVTEAISHFSKTLVSHKVPAKLAGGIATLPFLAAAVDISFLAKEHKNSVGALADIFFALDHQLGLSWLRDKAQHLPQETSLQRDAVQSLLDELYETHFRLTRKVLTGGRGRQTVEAWLKGEGSKADAVLALLRDNRSHDTHLDFAALTLLSRHINRLAH
jgi:glutamate dehydrogenase